MYQITKNWGPGPYHSLCHADNKTFFRSLSNLKLKGRAHVLLGEGSGKIWTCSCYFIMINEFKDGQTWKICPSPLVYHITVPLIEKIDGYKNNSGNSSTTKVGKHIPSGFSVFTIPSFKCIENKHVYKGKDCMKKVLWILVFKNKKMKLLSKEQQESY